MYFFCNFFVLVLKALVMQILSCSGPASGYASSCYFCILLCLLMTFFRSLAFISRSVFSCHLRFVINKWSANGSCFLPVVVKPLSKYENMCVGKTHYHGEKNKTIEQGKQRWGLICMSLTTGVKKT